MTLPDVPGKVKNLEGVQGAPAHGIEISPNGKELWVASKWWGYVFAYSQDNTAGQVIGTAATEAGLKPHHYTRSDGRKSTRQPFVGAV